MSRSIDNNEAMGRESPPHRIGNFPERPYRRITVTIRLNLDNESPQNNHGRSLQLDLSNLRKVLENTHNMEEITFRQDLDILIITGIPPDHDFGPQQVLEAVQNYAPNAVLVPADD